jgi:hypothetical protein
MRNAFYQNYFGIEAMFISCLEGHRRGILAALARVGPPERLAHKTRLQKVHDF